MLMDETSFKKSFSKFVAESNCEVVLQDISFCKCRNFLFSHFYFTSLGRNFILLIKFGRIYTAATNCYLLI